MKILKQSPLLQEAFQKQVNEKNFSQQQVVQDDLSGGLLGAIGQFKQIQNQAKGSLGEHFISLLAMSLPDTWVMCKNAFIPTTEGKLTEIDLLIIGLGGVFLIEVKTWQGSFSAYRDRWKRREGTQWIPLENSPTQQSLYHQKMFTQWMSRQIPELPQELIVAPVVFSIAKWLGVKDCSVPVFQGFKELKQMLSLSPSYLTAEQVSKISQVIKDYQIPTDVQSSLKSKPILRNKKMLT